jgi:hypothetical protein
VAVPAAGASAAASPPASSVIADNEIILFVPLERLPKWNQEPQIFL